MTHNTFLRKFLVGCTILTTSTIAQSSLYTYDSQSSSLPLSLSLQSVDEAKFYTTAGGPNLTAGSLTVGTNIYGPGAIRVYTGGGINPSYFLSFTSPLGINGSTINSLSVVNLVAGGATDANGTSAGGGGDGIGVYQDIYADQIIAASGDGGAGDATGHAGGTGGSVYFTGALHIMTSQGMTLTTGSSGNGGSGSGGGVGGDSGNLEFIDNITSYGNIALHFGGMGTPTQTSMYGNIGSILFEGDVTLNNNAYITTSNVMPGPSIYNGTAIFIANITGASGFPVLEFDQYVAVFIGGGTAHNPITVTGDIVTTQPLTGQQTTLNIEDGQDVTFNGKVGFNAGSSGPWLDEININTSNPYKVTFTDDIATSILFIAGAGTTILQGNATTGALIVDGARMICQTLDNMQFSGTIDGYLGNYVGSLYVTNKNASFSNTIGPNYFLSHIGIGYSIDGTGAINISPSQADFGGDVNAASMAVVGSFYQNNAPVQSSAEFDDVSLNLNTSLILFNSNLIFVAGNQNATISAPSFYIADGLDATKLNALLGTNFTQVGQSSSSITIIDGPNNHNFTFYDLIGSAITSNSVTYAAHPIDSVILGDGDLQGPDSISATVLNGMNVTQLTLGTDSDLYLNNVQLVTGAYNSALVFNVNSSNGPASIIDLTMDATSSNPGAITTTSATINLSNATLTASASTAAQNAPPTQPSSIVLKGNINLNTLFFYNAGVSNGIGNVVINDNGSTLDISQANIGITLDAGGQTAPGHVSYQLFSGTGSIVPASGTLGASHFIGSINPSQLAPLVWTYDPSTYTLFGDLQPISIGPNSVGGLPASTNIVALVRALTTPPAGSAILTDTQVAVLNQVGAAPTLSAALNQVGAMIVTGDTEDSNEEAAMLHSKDIQNHLLLPMTDLPEIGLQITEGEGGVAAGSDFDKRRGAWISGFTEKVKQKSYSHTVGYKLKTYGGTFGIDTNLTEKTVVGFAWTNAHSVVKQIGSMSKSNISTNIFSLYGLHACEGNWFVQGSLSAGLSNTKKVAARHNAGAIVPARAKHKSQYYGAEIQAIKRIKAGDSFLLEPTLGLSYSQFNDDSYREYEGAQNWSVSKRMSYNLEGLLGGRAMYSVHKGDWLYRPYISGYAHINLKDKRGGIHTSMDPLLHIDFQQTKASRVWYSTGAGLYMYKDNLEIAAFWELQLDKKYVGNIGALKVRVEF